MGSQSLYLCGFPEARVEMKVAPFRALTHHTFRLLHKHTVPVEMKVAPFRALTQTHSNCHRSLGPLRRNEGRPFQGIDTIGVKARME